MDYKFISKLKVDYINYVTNKHGCIECIDFKNQS